MRARMILELDPLASIEANMEFLRKCERDIQAKKERLKNMKKIPKTQIDLEDSIKEVSDEDLKQENKNSNI